MTLWWIRQLLTEHDEAARTSLEGGGSEATEPNEKPVETGRLKEERNPQTPKSKLT